MNWLEVVKVIAEVATAVFALALVRATYVLAKVTRRMDEHEMERRRNEELRACISLAESIISPARFNRAPVIACGYDHRIDAVHDALVMGRGPVGIHGGEGV